MILLYVTNTLYVCWPGCLIMTLNIAHGTSFAVITVINVLYMKSPLALFLIYCKCILIILQNYWSNIQNCGLRNIYQTMHFVKLRCRSHLIQSLKSKFKKILNFITFLPSRAPKLTRGKSPQRGLLRVMQMWVWFQSLLRHLSRVFFLG